MHKRGFLYPAVQIFTLFLFLSACNDSKQPPASDIVVLPELLDEKVKGITRDFLEFAADNNGNIGDSVFLTHHALLQQVYQKKEFNAVWSGGELWKPLGDSMLRFVADAKLFGLFPEDYHFTEIDTINKRFINDKWGERDRGDATLWSKADLLMTDAFFKMVKDIRLGRLPKDSLTLRRDSVLTDSFYLKQWEMLEQSGSLQQVMTALEPVHKDYHELKACIRRFLDSTAHHSFTFVPAAGRDSLSKETFRKALQRRLFETGFIANDSIPADSAMLAEAVKKFQKKHDITVDGKAGGGTLQLLNLTDREKFIRIALSLDKYKQLPDTMPVRYVWVNLPAYYMELRENDTVKIRSKIICGKAKTRTPLLTSAISEMITYPQWTVPNSIIVKEILPAAKRDPGYFAKKGFSLIDDDGNEVDPYAVEWTMYNKGIPYKVVQGSGDDNALGILKFNFYNKYSVYLHDTNQRYLFNQAVRSLSHGCVRVQEWRKLANAILSYDNPEKKKLKERTDSLETWLVRKEKHSIGVRKRLPLFVRYFTCEARNGEIYFYDDVYGEDKLLRERYFAKK